MKTSIWMAVAVLRLAGSVLAAQGRSVTTTIYVGKHFEVRDHDQPTKYVFNGLTRVAEITGSLSANLRVQRLRLYSGWNLCSLAVSGPFPANGAEAISAAYQWTPSTGRYLQITLGQTLAAGTILWLKARTNAVVSALGAYADPVPRQVQAGGTYISGTGLEAWSPVLQASASSWDFDASTAQWFGHLAGDLASISDAPPTLSPAQALYLEATAPVSLEIPDPTLRIRYYHQDHLGSSAAISDANGSLVQESAFYPFGTPRNEYHLRQVEPNYQFTEKERDRETGLHYFETRYLASSLSRFVTPDLKYACPDRFSAAGLSAYASVPQQFNLYAYVRNNPLKYIDPLGQDARGKDEPERADLKPTSTLTLKGGNEEFTIPISSMSFRANVSYNENGKTGSSEPSQQTVYDFVITRSVDKTSPALIRKAKGIDTDNVEMSGEITLRSTVAGHSEVYMKIKLTSVLISGYSASGHGGDLLMESFHLDVTKIEFVYPKQNAGAPAVLRNRYYKLEPPSPFEYTFSTGRPAERQAAESCGGCATYAPQ